MCATLVGDFERQLVGSLWRSGLLQVTVDDPPQLLPFQDFSERKDDPLVKLVGRERRINFNVEIEAHPLSPRSRKKRVLCGVPQRKRSPLLGVTVELPAHGR